MLYEPFNGFVATVIVPVLGLALLVTALVKAGWHSNTTKDLGDQVQENINKML